MDIIKAIEHEQLKPTIPELKVGNTVKVHARIKEGNKERIQVFEGIIIKIQGKGVNQTFTVRKISYGVGVEKTFLIHSPLVEKIELVRIGKARRAKLFYLRDRIGKAAKTKEIAGARIENKEIQIKGGLETPETGEAEDATNQVVEETVETPVEEKVETPVVEAKAEEKVETPVAEAKVEEKVEAPVAEEKVEEVKAEAPVEETKAEEVKAETPVEEVKPTEEKTEAPAKATVEEKAEVKEKTKKEDK